jgi:hypothetical protein
LTKPFAARHADLLRHRLPGGARRFGHRDHHVGHQLGGDERAAETPAELHARLVDRRAVEERVGPREVDVLEDARAVRLVADLADVRHAVLADPQHLTGAQVAHDLVAGDVEHDGFAGHGVPGALRRHLLAEDARLDAVRVAERIHALAGDADDRVGALHPLEHFLHRRLHVVDGDRIGEPAHQRVGEHVEHDLEVAVAAEMDVALAEVGALQLVEIGDVAVVRHRRADRVVEPERLHVGVLAEADRGVAHVGDREVAAQTREKCLSWNTSRTRPRPFLAWNLSLKVTAPAAS